MSDFHAAHPDYATTSRLDELRVNEYSYLDSGGHTYLDYTGAGLVNVQVLGLAAAVRDGRLRFGGGRGVAVVAERGFGDDPGL